MQHGPHRGRRPAARLRERSDDVLGRDGMPLPDQVHDLPFGIGQFHRFRHGPRLRRQKVFTDVNIVKRTWPDRPPRHSVFSGSGLGLPGLSPAPADSGRQRSRSSCVANRSKREQEGDPGDEFEAHAVDEQSGQARESCCAEHCR